MLVLNNVAVVFALVAVVANIVDVAVAVVVLICADMC